MINNITIITQLVSVLLLVVGLLYAGYQLSLTRKVHKENHEWNRRFAAQQALSRKIEGLDELNEAFKHMNLTDSIPMKEYREAFEKSPQLQPSLHRYLNYFEDLCRGMLYGVYDEDIIRNARGGTFDKVYNNHRNFIENRRKEVHPLVYRHLREVVENWRINNDVPLKKEKIGKTE